MLDSAPLIFAIAMLGGVVAQVVGRHLAIPGIVLLLAAGVLLGPDVANVIRPQALGSALGAIVGFSVAIILFEGGLRLEVVQLRKQAVVIRRLVLLGGFVTAAGGALACDLLMGWDLRLSILFGTLVIVTGPTVISPLVRRIRLAPSLATILEAEGVFIDSIGAMIALMALEVARSPSTGTFSEAALEVALRLGTGTAIGAAGGLVIGAALRVPRAIPRAMANVFALAGAVTVYELSHALISDSGIPAAMVAGLVVGNMRVHRMSQLAEFKEQLTLLLIGTLFVLLAADVRIADVAALGWRAIAVVAALSLVVRPLEVLLCTAGAGLGRREKLYLAWISPRGIVAAAVASLFADQLAAAGIPGGVALRALVFTVIAVTVTVQGLTAGPLAKLLGLRHAADRGYVILGANALARHVARRLRDAGEPLELIDYDPDDCRAAEEAGLKIIHGNGLEARTLTRSRADARTHAVAITGNEGVNQLFAQHIVDDFHGPRVLVGIDVDAYGVTAEMVRGHGAAVLFGRPEDLGGWIRRWRRGQVDVRRLVYTGGAPHPLRDAPAGEVLALFVERDGALRLIDDGVELRAGDVVELALARDRRERADAWLAGGPWRPLDGGNGLTPLAAAAA
ncbi:MAG TPA: cation:proton antiporter [Kofleriaceae bacterium]|nr:cation:proton antiporter [Kofleriaceae bacterium]